MNRIYRPVCAFVLFLMLVVVGACTYDFPDEEAQPVQSGSADFSNYIAMGNSLTAGYMNGALYREGQESSFPLILAKQMRMAEPSLRFEQPLLAEGNNGWNGSFLPNGQPAGKLKFTLPEDCEEGGLSPIPTLGKQPEPYTGDRSILNNFGVPSLRVLETALPGYDTLNPFFGHFNPQPLQPYAQVVAEAQASFFTLWLGNNDVLLYALEGGVGKPDPGPNPLAHGRQDMTNVGVFQQSYEGLLQAIFQANPNAKGVVATIPAISDIPYFKLVNQSLLAPTVSVDSSTGNFVAERPLPFLLDSANASGLNQLYAAQGATQVNFKSEENFPVIEAKAADSSVILRHFDPTRDRFTLRLPTDSLLSGPIGPCTPGQRAFWGIANPATGETKPIPDRYVLDKQEIAWVEQRIQSLNQVISQAVDKMNAQHGEGSLVIADMHAAFQAIPESEKTLTPGKLFSLDGVHPNARGYARVANEFIRTINQGFGARLRTVDVSDYESNAIPSAP